MPQAVTHVIVPILIVAIIRDFIVKKRFSTFYVLVAGISGLIPDLDITVYWFLNIFSKVPLSMVHRWFFHSIFIPIFFLALALILYKKRKYFLFFEMVALGTFIHIILDLLLAGYVRPLYPLSSIQIGLNIIPPTEMGNTIMLGIDAILLVLWLIWEYKQRNIKDYI
jgi:membrane-bound metal-dependent hydrolase YbcI (DUF457 family)